jgi:DNA-binding NarL/FixJ family response regulator
MNKIRLLIADDHAAVRRGLKQLFGMLDDVVVAAEAEDDEQALQAVRRGALDLALIDLSMPGTSGIELIEHIRAQDPRLLIVVLSMHSEPQIVQRALDAGAQAYLVKGCDAEQVVEAVRRVASVAVLLDKGCTADAIARRLGICVDTARRYVERVQQERLASGSGNVPPDEQETEEKTDGPRTDSR